MLSGFGQLVCDLQAFGHQWPGVWEPQPATDKLLLAMATDAYCPRISPPQLHRKALIEAITDSSCDLVICQLAQTDDTFGWELPRLAAELAECGIRFVNLGFRDQCPEAGWLSGAARQISAALERFP